MKRITLFFYYCYTLQFPHHDTYIFSPGLAWKLAGIAARAAEREREFERRHKPDEAH